jgi:NAD+ kinase
MKIALFGQYYQNSSAETVQKVVSFLESKKIEIAFEANFLAILKEKNIVSKNYETYSSYNTLDTDFKALISIGGDGTILRAATFVRDKNIPIIGINAGRLGFLATIQFNNIEPLLQKLLDNDYAISKRTLLSISTTPEYENFSELDFALNEVTVARKHSCCIQVTIDNFLLNLWIECTRHTVTGRACIGHDTKAQFF